MLQEILKHPSIWRKLLLKFIDYWLKLIKNMPSSQKLVNEVLNALKVVILIQKTRSVQVNRKNLKTQICKYYWMNSTQIFELLTEALNVTQSITSERSRRKENVIHMKWRKETLNGKKPLVKFCLLDRKGFLYQVVTGDKNWIYFDKPKCRKS